MECLLTYFNQKFECPACACATPKYIAINKNAKSKFGLKNEW